MSCSTSSVYIIKIKIQKSKTVTNWSNSNNLTEEIDSTQQLCSQSKEEEIEVNLPSSHLKVEAAAKAKLPSSIQKDEEAATKNK